MTAPYVWNSREDSISWRPILVAAAASGSRGALRCGPLCDWFLPRQLLVFSSPRNAFSGISHKALSLLSAPGADRFSGCLSLVTSSQALDSGHPS